MRTHTRHTRIAQNSSELGSRVFGETGEARIRVTYRRAQLNRLKSGLGKLFDGAGKILGDHVSDRPRLASEGHAERIGAKLQTTCGNKADRGCLRCRVFEKISSRHGH